MEWRSTTSRRRALSRTSRDTNWVHCGSVGSETSAAMTFAEPCSFARAAVNSLPIWPFDPMMRILLICTLLECGGQSANIDRHAGRGDVPMERVRYTEQV